MRYKFLCLLLLLVSCSKKDDDNRTPDPSVQPNYKVVKGQNGKTYHTGLLPKTAEQKKHLGETRVHLSGCDNLPDNFDLRTLGVVSPIRDQGQCGSCWSFSMVGSLESSLLGAGKGQFDLAEQELVSCDKANIGCQGGNLNGFDYLIKHGVSLEKDYPYTASDSRCKTASVAAKGSSFMYVGSETKGPTEDELKCALFKYHTVPWITADASDWGNPPSSEDQMFNSCGSNQTNHAIGVVGWKKINGKTGFIMKNSWGTNWGDKGYMTLPLGCSAFGEEVAFIQVDAPAPTPTPVPTPTPPNPTPTPPGPTPTPTPPGPCKLPLFKLPSSVQIDKGAEVMVGVKPQAGVYYVWMAAGLQVGEGSILYASPEQDTVYKLSGTNSCGIVESSVLVKVGTAK